jgi:hypothetical protein
LTDRGARACDKWGLACKPRRAIDAGRVAASFGRDYVFCREILDLHFCKILDRAPHRGLIARNPTQCFAKATAFAQLCSFWRAGGQASVRRRAAANKFQSTGSAPAPGWAAAAPIGPD